MGYQVIIMTYARMTVLRFRSGMRDEGMRRIDTFQEDLRGSEGFVEIHAFLSMDNPDQATLVSIWDSLDSLNSSMAGALSRAIVDVEPLLGERPEFEDQVVWDMGNRQVVEPDEISSYVSNR